MFSKQVCTEIDVCIIILQLFFYKNTKIVCANNA